MPQKEETGWKQSAEYWKVPEEIQLGMWEMEIDQSTGRHLLSVQEGSGLPLEIPQSLDGEESYCWWHERILRRDRDNVNETIQVMIASGRLTEMEFVWNHPQRGQVSMCWTGICSKSEHNVAELKGYYRIMDDIIRLPSKADSQNIVVEKKYLIKSDFYQTMLSETTGYMEVELDSGIIHSSGGIWEKYAQMSQERHLNFQAIGKKYIKEVVIKQDYDLYRDSMDLEKIRKMYREGTETMTCQFRRLVEDAVYHWMELVIHVFEEKESGKTYGLFYIKDIDETKKKHLKQERAAAMDPLTKVMNRRNFEMSVREVIRQQKRTRGCALLIFDIDNFKKINDGRGHQAGDDVLKEFAVVLTEAFRKSDDIGRFGGDEFMVFVQNMSRHTIDQRLRSIQKRLKNSKTVSVTCSIGIYILTDEALSYKQCMERADQAMYMSKKRGKDTFCYWDEIS